MWGYRKLACPLLASTALLAGCGGSGYTKADYVARANAICAGALRQIRSIPPPQGNDLAIYLQQVLPVMRSETSQLRSLRIPPGSPSSRAVLQRFNSALGQRVSDYRQWETAARRGDAQAAAAAEGALRVNTATSLAASYGLSSCATAGPTAR